jgi:hypothetical protein
MTTPTAGGVGLLQSRSLRATAGTEAISTDERETASAQKQGLAVTGSQISDLHSGLSRDFAAALLAGVQNRSFCAGYCRFVP